LRQENPRPGRRLSLSLWWRFRVADGERTSAESRGAQRIAEHRLSETCQGGAEEETGDAGETQDAKSGVIRHPPSLAAWGEPRRGRLLRSCPRTLPQRHRVTEKSGSRCGRRPGPIDSTARACVAG